MTIKTAIITVILGLVSIAPAATIYVDADEANTTPADGSGGAWSSTETSNNDDQLWDKRTGYGNNASGQATGSQTIYQSQQDDCPLIVTTLSGLTPGGLYKIEVVYWSKSASEDWCVRAGLASNELTFFNYTGSNTSGFPAVAGTKTGVVQAGIYEMLGDLGMIEADEAGQIQVFVNDIDDYNSSHAYRSWYDGLRYEEISLPYCQNPSVYDLTGDCVVDVNDLGRFAQEWLQAGTPVPPGPGQVFPVINDNGAWCWFEDERAIIDNGKLLVSSVATAAGTGGSPRNGNIEIATYDFATGQTDRFVLHANLQADDHDSAALLIRLDGRYLAMYAKHGSDNYVRYRISTNPHDATAWQPEQTFNATAGTTYSNVYQLSAESGRIFLFHRALNWNPTMSYSDDDGETWTLGGKLMTYSGRPYVRYASNNIDEVHFITTEHHPRDFNNSIYHGYVKNGKVYNSDGVVIDDNIYDTNAADPSDYTQIFAANTVVDGNPMTRCWTVDFELDADDNPYAIFQARIDPGSVSRGGDSLDHMFFYARYDGTNWHWHKLAHAGRDIYAASPNGDEDDYTGLVSLVPNDPDTVYISTDVDPVTANALISSADGQQHYEIFKGVTADSGATWTWTPITENSSVSNYRPMVPESDGTHTALLWMAGQYGTYQSYDLDVVGLMTPLASPLCDFPPMDFNRNCRVDLPDLANLAKHWLDCGWYPQSFCD